MVGSDSGEALCPECLEIVFVLRFEGGDGGPEGFFCGFFGGFVFEERGVEGRGSGWEGEFENVCRGGLQRLPLGVRGCGGEFQQSGLFGVEA